MKTEKIKIWEIFVYSDWLDRPDYTSTDGIHPVFLEQALAERYVKEKNEEFLANKQAGDKILHDRREAERVRRNKVLEEENNILVRAGLRKPRAFDTTPKPFIPKSLDTELWNGKLRAFEDEITIAYSGEL